MNRLGILLIGALALPSASCHVDWDCDVCAAQEPVTYIPYNINHCPHPTSYGYLWDGHGCQEISGCDCQGCEELTSKADCEQTHQACNTDQCQ